MHLFRHQFASGLAAASASTGDLVAAGGWSSSRMAERYAHVTQERLLALANRAIRDRGTSETRKSYRGTRLARIPLSFRFYLVDPTGIEPVTF